MRLSSISRPFFAACLAALPIACGAAPDGSDPAGASAENEHSGTAEEALTITTRPLLVILLQRDSTTPLAHNAAFYTSRIFGPSYPNVKDYYSAVTNGHLTFSNAGVLTVSNPNTAAFDTSAGITAGMVGTDKTRLRALKLAANAGFDFSKFDTNGDKIITPTELAVLEIDDASNTGGQTGSVSFANQKYGTVTSHLTVSLSGQRSQLMNFAHELMHQSALAPDVSPTDLYGEWGVEELNLNETLMSITGGSPDGSDTWGLDPFYRYISGWYPATTISEILYPDAGDQVDLTAMPNVGSGNGQIFFWRDGTYTEAIIAEYRKANTTYEKNVAQTGIVFWNVKYTRQYWQLASVASFAAPHDQIPAMFTLSPQNCVGDASSAASRGVTDTSYAFGSSYRLKWEDGTDTGMLFTPMTTSNSSVATIKWEPSKAAPSCPQNWPDYEVTSVSSPPVLSYIGGSLTITDTTTNTGLGTAPASTTTYWLSTDGAKSSDDVKLGSRSVPSLAVGANSTGSATLTIPTGPATPNFFYVIACANSGNRAELNPDDDCITSSGAMLLPF